MTSQATGDTRRHRLTPPSSRALLSAPRVAWPTLVLFVVCLSCWLASLAALACSHIPPLVASAFSTIAAYAIFTPMHEASHQSVGRSRLLNEIVGRIAAIPLGGFFPVFRDRHLEHHKFTNEPERDPDFWVALPPAGLRPLRWLSMEWPYTVLARRRAHRLPRRVRAEITFWLLFLIIAVVGPSLLGFGRLVFFGWLLPAKFAGAFLAYAFDYLPHRPHAVSSRTDRFRATLVQPDAWRTPVFLFQNYHLIHHLYPAVPFYRYSRIWAAQRDMLLSNGAIER
jgi:fatty acid desaturase